jgi:hypothetical protein
VSSTKPDIPETGCVGVSVGDGDGDVVALFPPLHADAQITSRTTNPPRFFDIGSNPPRESQRRLALESLLRADSRVNGDGRLRKAGRTLPDYSRFLCSAGNGTADATRVDDEQRTGSQLVRPVFTPRVSA